MSMLPAIFVSHGAPTLPFDDVPARDFLRGLGKALGRPKAIIAISAHWDTDLPAASAPLANDTIHDFRGFPQPLYALEYPAPSDALLAREISGLLNGLAARTDATRGLDHGAWVPLMLMYPQADIPVTQLAVQPERDTKFHFGLGEALSQLRDDGILILASGGATHNLYEFGRHRRDAPPPEWVTAFQEWLASTIESGNTSEFLDYRTIGPNGARNHPSEEHFLPIFVAAGASIPGSAGKRIHRSHSYGILAMDAYRFD